MWLLGLVDRWGWALMWWPCTASLVKGYASLFCPLAPIRIKSRIKPAKVRILETKLYIGRSRVNALQCHIIFVSSYIGSSRVTKRPSYIILVSKIHTFWAFYAWLYSLWPDWQYRVITSLSRINEPFLLLLLLLLAAVTYNQVQPLRINYLAS